MVKPGGHPGVIHRLSFRIALNNIVTRTSPNDVVASSADERIGAMTAVKFIVACVAAEPIVTGALFLCIGIDDLIGVFSVPAMHNIIALAPFQNIVAQASRYQIGAGISPRPIVAGKSGYMIAATATVQRADRIVRCGSDEGCDCVDCVIDAVSAQGNAEKSRTIAIELGDQNGVVYQQWANPVTAVCKAIDGLSVYAGVEAIADAVAAVEHRPIIGEGTQTIPIVERVESVAGGVDIAVIADAALQIIVPASSFQDIVATAAIQTIEGVVAAQRFAAD